MNNPNGGQSAPPPDGPHPPPHQNPPPPGPGHQPTEPYPQQPTQQPPPQGVAPTAPYPPQQPYPGQGPGPTQQYPSQGVAPTEQFPPQQYVGQQPTQQFPSQGVAPTEQFPSQQYVGQQPTQQYPGQYPPQASAPSQQYPYQQQYAPQPRPPGSTGGAGPQGSNNAVLFTVLAITMVAGLGVALALIFRNRDGGGSTATTPTTATIATTVSPTTRSANAPVTIPAPTIAPSPTAAPTTFAPVTEPPTPVTEPPTPVTEPPTPGGGAPPAPEGLPYTDPEGHYTMTVGADWTEIEPDDGDEQWDVVGPSGSYFYVSVLTVPALGATLDEELNVTAEEFEGEIGFPTEVVNREKLVGVNGNEMGVVHLRVTETGVDPTDMLLVIDVSSGYERIGLLLASTSEFDEARASVEPYLLTLQAAS